MTSSWGVIRPEATQSSRQLLDLQLGRATRHFNELSFPGIGGVYFVRQISWSAAGITLAEHSGEPAMRVAEAVEALACWIALFLPGPGQRFDAARIQGKRNLSKERGYAYDLLKNRVNYVSQPFRVGTTAAMVGLGLAQGNPRRFNGLCLTADGRFLANLVLGSNNGAIGRWLHRNWINVKTQMRIPDVVKEALLPGMTGMGTSGTLSDERRLVRTLLVRDPIRRTMITALERVGPAPGEHGGVGTGAGNAQLLDKIADPDQKRKVLAAFAFEELRDAALNVVRFLAARVSSGRQMLPILAQQEELLDRLALLRQRALELRQSMVQAGITQSDASRFCHEQMVEEGLPRLVSLLDRLPGVFSYAGATVARGHLLRDDLALADERAAASETVAVPTPNRLLRAHLLIKDASL